MATQPKVTMDLKTGGFVTIDQREDYTVLLFTQKADADLFLKATPNAERRNVQVKWASSWTDGKRVANKIETYQVLVRK